VEYASASLENQDRAKALDSRIGAFSAHAHAALAEVAKASAEFDAIGGWGAGGIRSFPHWLTIKTGFDMHMGAVSVIWDACEFAEARAGPDG
jgi:hypothetical protein